MNFLDNIKERLIHAKNSAVHAIIPHVLAESETSSSRIEMCNSCEFLFAPTKQCKKCGCFVNVKTLLASAQCPIGKWPAINIEDRT